MQRFGHRGQTTAEYAVVIGLVVAAIVAMQVFVKRSVQAKVKDVTDSFAATASGTTGSEKQFEPDYASSSYTVGQTNDSTDAVVSKGAVDRTKISEKTTRASGGHTDTAAPAQ